MALSAGSMAGIFIGAIGSILITYYLIARWSRVIEARARNERKKKIHAARRYTKAVTRDLEAGVGTAPGGRNLNARNPLIRPATGNASFSSRYSENDTVTTSSTQDSNGMTSDLQTSAGNTPTGRGA